MGIELDDGSIIPSQLSPNAVLSGNSVIRANHGLRTGQVIKIHYSDDSTNISKKYHEYDVLVAHGDAKIGTNISVYRNCKVSNVFASNTDSETYTLKPGEPAKNGKGTYDGGAIVTLLCIDGRPDAGQALILGGLNSPNFKFKEYKKDDGHFYDFNFNGINININKDGEYSIEFNSVLDKNSNPTNKDAQGTKIKMDKDGRIKISDNKDQSWELDRVAEKSIWTNKNESIVIDKKNKNISMNSSGDINTESNKNTSLKSKSNMNLESKANMSIRSDANQNVDVKGNASLKASNWNVNVSGSINVKSGGAVNIQGGSLAALKALQVLLGQGSIQAAGVGISICQGFDSHGSPVISQILTGSSSVKIGT
jgi:hypothetical protein